MNSKNVFEVETLAEQIYLTMGEGEKKGIKKKYNMTFLDVARVF